MFNLCTIPERPDISQERTINLAKKHFGLNVVHIKEFIGYDDRNFHVVASSGAEYVMKITNSDDSANDGVLDAQNRAMLLLKSRGIKCNVPHVSVNKEYISYEQSGDKGPNAIRLFDYIEGTLLAKVPMLTQELLFKLGQYVGRLDSILKEYSHPSLNEETIIMWDLQNICMIEKYIDAKYLGSKDREELIFSVYKSYMSTVPAALRNSNKQVIHNDVNNYNIIVFTDQAFSIIDFGDMSYSYCIFEIAIFMADIILTQFKRGTGNHFDCATNVLKGYQSVFPLSRSELELLYWCIGARFAQLVVIGSVKLFMDPKNTYVMANEIHIWDLLPQYLAISDTNMLQKWLQDINLQ